MAKNDNAHSLRMTAAIRDVIGQEAAADFEARFALSKAASVEKKFQWAQAACLDLTERFDRAELMRIRERCICNDGASTAKLLAKYRREAGSLQGMVELFNSRETFAWLEYVSDRELVFCYPQCYCGCVKRGDGLLPEAWCYCTVGYAKRLFGQLLGEAVQAELLESIKTGGKRCAVRVTW